MFRPRKGCQKNVENDSQRNAQGDPKIFKNHEKSQKVMVEVEVVKITVPVNLRKELQNIAEVVYLEHFVTTLGVQMILNVTLGAFEWESEILCFFATR